jgi:hypothetical protein
MILQNKLKYCDIIFSYSVKSPLEQLIADCGLNYGSQLINHVVLYIGNNQIIQANHNGVVISNLDSFINEVISLKGNLYFVRLNFYLSKKQQNSIINRAKQFLNLKYNFSFNNSQEQIYCSELIILAFDALNNSYNKKNPFKRHKITFNNPYTQELDLKWLQYYDNNNVDNIPQNTLGSHPNSLFNNQNIHLIKKIKRV